MALTGLVLGRVCLQTTSRRFASSASSSDTIAKFVAARVEADEYKDALRICHQDYQHEPFRWTWGELNSWSNAWARGILDARMAPKPNQQAPRLAYSLANDAESVVTDFAAARAGVPTASLAPDAPVGHFECCFENVAPRLVVIMDQFKGEWKTSMIRDLIPELRNNPKEFDVLKPFTYKSIRNVIHTGMDASPGIGNFSHHLQKNPVRDPLNAIETSGDQLHLLTPHDGRWVGFDQASLVQSGREFAKAMGLNREDRVNMNLSLASVSGKAAGLFGVLDQMSCLVIPDRSFSAQSTVDSFTKEVCNTLMVTPSQLKEVLAVEGVSPAKFDGLQKLIVVSDDGSLPSADSLSQAKSKLGASDIRVAVGSSGVAPFLVSGSGDPLSLEALPGAQVTAKDGVLHSSGSYIYSSVCMGGQVSSEGGSNATGISGKVEGGKVSL
uniref:AMP-dependent synthetase/ligase domain-containing protein n=1 Tax=Paramoeba aestuarina TaxID=180227 RepID=A0A7S4JTG0_9EUKA|mmetsp:Transcript_12911/g.19856  ORF Transcript_12911/g.19856 Transcript_12911/m.19856 type:complete len:440 (+) Transcript_12911:355-1674(+)